MKKLTYSLAGLVLAASAAHAQPTEEPAGDAAAPSAHAGHAEPAAPAAPAEPAADAAAGAAADAGSAQPATPAEPAAPPAASLAVADVSDAEVDSFAKATVKLQSIQADASIAAEQKQTAMQAAVTEAGLDPAKYNAIGKAVQADPALRARVQTAMSRHAAPAPTEG
jgi:hypothetical protein